MLTGATFLFVMVMAFAQVTACEQGTIGSQSFRDAFDTYVLDDAIVGAAYVVVDNGRIVEWHSTGMADRDLKQPVDQNTIFHWGSITKTLTAVAVMQLRDRHQLSLDDSMTSHSSFGKKDGEVLIHTRLQPGDRCQEKGKPFQTVSRILASGSTWLKPGENETGSIPETSIAFDVRTTFHAQPLALNPSVTANVRR